MIMSYMCRFIKKLHKKDLYEKVFLEIFCCIIMLDINRLYIRPNSDHYTGQQPKYYKRFLNNDAEAKYDFFLK